MVSYHESISDPSSSVFCCIDELIATRIASFLDLFSTYRWVCACNNDGRRQNHHVSAQADDDNNNCNPKNESDDHCSNNNNKTNNNNMPSTVLSPEWFFRCCTLDYPDELEILPLEDGKDDEDDALSRFYLAETTNQMQKCRFIPKYCSMGVHQTPSNTADSLGLLAKALDVDRDSVYVQYMALLLSRLLQGANHIAEDVMGKDTFHLHELLAGTQAFGFRNLPPHDVILDLTTLSGISFFLTVLELPFLVCLEEAMLRQITMMTTTWASDTNLLRELLARTFHAEMSLQYDPTFSSINYRFQNTLLQALQTISMETSSSSSSSSDDDHEDDYDMDELIQKSDNFWNNKTHGQAATEYHEIHGITIQEQAEMDFNHALSELERLRDHLLSLDHYDDYILVPPSKSRHDAGFHTAVDSNATNKYLNHCWDVESISAQKFFHQLVQEIHSGIVLEVKVKKKTSPLATTTWDYGILLGPSGTFWRSLVMNSKCDNESDKDDVMSDEEDDEDFIDEHCLLEDVGNDAVVSWVSHNISLLELN